MEDPNARHIIHFGSDIPSDEESSSGGSECCNCANCRQNTSMVNLLPANFDGGGSSSSSVTTESTIEVISKEDLKRRLALFLQRVMKKPLDPDDMLPGDKTKKYALRCRMEN